MRPPRLVAPLAAALSLVVSGAGPARAAVPTAMELLKLLDLPTSDAEKAKAGEFVSVSISPSNERELTSGLIFLVKGLTPSEIVKRGRNGLLDKLDPNTVAVQLVEGDPTAADFAKFGLGKDGAGLAKEFLKAEPGSDLNLSSEEIAAFQKLGSGASQSAVEGTLRSMLLARMQAYHTRGLAGIAPYARSDGEARSPADDLRSATQKLKLLEKLLPDAYQMLLNYPKAKVAGSEEVLRWSRIEAHGEPTLVLTHNVYIPDGEAWVAMQRQFYVSAGYNCEQAVSAFIPVKGGTAVFYTNRTSTDQVTGFGGSAKRSLGSKVLRSQLEELFETLRTKAGSVGD